MHHSDRWPKLLLVPLVLATAALAANRSVSQLPPGEPAFVIDLDTSGGFTGKGRGGVTVDSAGRVRAVAAVRLQPWPATFAPAGDDGCCDRHQWTLRWAQRDADDRVRKSETMWYDGNEDRLPKEVMVIRDAALRALGRTLADCDRR